MPDGTAASGPAEAAGWIAELVRRPPHLASLGTRGGRGTRLHVPGCWVISRETTGVVIDTGQALDLLRVDPVASACDVCARDLAGGAVSSSG
ncbi:DUF6233 domain-containing protein [Streptomyces sp. NPDC087440]|uniref:DUF6233 domain-containing protein n=1 Tax=Streptomyces sp. NPDC087440 TaxID=3365790 RepID=UPI0038149BC7